MGGLRTASRVNPAPVAIQAGFQPDLSGLMSAVRGFSPCGATGKARLRKVSYQLREWYSLVAGNPTVKTARQQIFRGQNHFATRLDLSVSAGRYTLTGQVDLSVGLSGNRQW